MIKQVYYETDRADINSARVCIQNNHISIDFFKGAFKYIGHIKLIIDKNRIYLSSFYDTDIDAEDGIDTAVSDLIDYLLKDYIGSTIIVENIPYQIQNPEGKITKSNRIIFPNDLKPYIYNDFKLIWYRDVIRRKFDSITKEDFKRHGIKADYIIYKKVKKKEFYRFHEKDKIILDDSLMTEKSDDKE